MQPAERVAHKRSRQIVVVHDRKNALREYNEIHNAANPHP
jgi:hypothetical protein